MKLSWSSAGGGTARTLGTLLAGVLLVLAASGCGKPGPMRSDADAGDGGRLDGSVGGETNPDVRRDGTAGSDGGSCERGTGSKTTGQECSCAAECASGFCADGVCCNTACTEGCKTCDAPGGTPGTCVGIAAGSPPRTATACAATDASTCGLDGKCDGAGACRRHVPGTLCMPGRCDGDAVVGSFACDGAGRCKPGATLICLPYSCNQAAGTCYDSCTSNAQCVSGRQCVAGSCGKRPKGAKCEVDDQCVSGFCTDGVCCNVGCLGPCVSCATPMREGTCWPADQGQPDPHRQCRNMGESSCGQTGLCDGFGGCAKFPRETVCIPPSCSGNRLNTPGTCNGLGTCQQPGVQNCNPFRCVGSACTNVCFTDRDCADGIACVNNTCGPKLNGQVCQLGTECLSGNCVDSVCCENACTGACRSCALPSSAGRCMPIAAGSPDPRLMCAVQAESTCGTNGNCDGSGGCQKHPVNTVCAAETCVSNVYTPASMCNASGQCVAPDSRPCSPFGCNVNKCFTACTANNQCVVPNVCIDNSCGLKDPGAECTLGDECKSGFCAQGVCCDQACNTPCKSCIAGTLGVCSNVTNNEIDPEARCSDQGAASCGTNGRCEAGACQRYVSGTPCMPASCPTTTDLFTALSTCDGAGTCVTPAQSDCFPYQCGTNACLASCTSNDDCKAPAVCTNGTCGLKPPGAACSDREECLSGFCEQGFCCETACTGICKSCGLPQSRGTCSNLASGDGDLLSRCPDMGPTSCSTDGFCDGNGACRLYDANTTCAAASCPVNQSMLTTDRTCDGRGVCQPPSMLACAPYVCNGTTACKAACTVDGDCLAPNICDLQINRCGNKLRLGQQCTSTDQCLTGNYCVDGVCCSTMSCGLCQACNVGTSAGNCSNVLLGNPEPRNLCTPNPPCGNTGACNGAGACQFAATTVSCGVQSCTGSSFTPVSNCNGTGGCAPATASGCSPYVCGGDTCRTSCTADSHCLAPFTCQGTAPNRSCALKPNGVTCTAANQCISGNCVDGYCCGSASCPLCQACNITGSLGMCANIAAGAAAPSGQCLVSPPCGNTGACNGAGACQQTASTVSCGLAMSCTGTTFQAASFCSGSGACNQAATSSCNEYVCNTNGTCRTSCTADAHCSSTSLYCNVNGSCVAKKAPGAACGAPNECGTGSCTDGVCCATSSCSACQACNLNGAGTCSNVPNNMADPGSCAPNGECGNTGVCNGNGGCTQRSASTVCGNPISCTGTTFQPPSFCSGAGACNQTNTVDCGAYKCGTNNACRSTCTTDNDCTTGNYCTGNASAPGSCVAKKGLGEACGGGNQCTSNSCTDGVCCTTGSCPACQSCSGTGAAGTCSNVPNGSTDPGSCAASPPCGNTGVCVNGGCQQASASTTCGAAESCSGTTHQPPSFCNGSGQCSQTSTETCGLYVCGTTTCLQTCNNDGNCIGGHFCTGPGGSCTAKRGLGMSCSGGNQCNSGNCIDGVCCMTNGCSTCQACNLNGVGTCSNVGAGMSDPGSCAPNGECGNTGVCNGGGGCTQQPDTVTCGTAVSCSGTMYQPPSFCSGAGVCNQTSTTTCNGYVCGTNMCQTTCDDDGGCAGTHYCTGPGGMCLPKKTPGQLCGSGHECGTNNCVDGVCCNSGSCSACNSCNNAGNPGSCSADPNGGVCSGFSCPTSSTFQPSGTCMSGSCMAPAVEMCSPFICVSGGCRDTCVNDGHCLPGNFCNTNNGQCEAKRGGGDSCSGDSWCTSTHCTEGVCCGVAACDVCESCAASGNGTCAAVGAGQPPIEQAQCPIQAASTCGRNGLCDGNRMCQLYGTSTECSTSCDFLSGDFTRTYCDGAGMCGPGSVTDDCLLLCDVNGCLL